MSNFENTGPGGVGKRFGTRSLGGIWGVTQGASGEYTLTFETGPGEAAAASGVPYRITDSFATVEKVSIEVETPFEAGTVDITYAGSSILAAPIDLTVGGVIAAPLTVSPTVLESPGILGGKVLNVVFDGVTGDVGYMKSRIRIERV
jgi:hypothetical protein